MQYPLMSYQLSFQLIHIVHHYSGDRLLNRLLKHAGMDPVGYRAKVNSAFVALNNLETFMAGAKR